MRSQNGWLISLTLPRNTAVDRFNPSTGPSGAAHVQASAKPTDMESTMPKQHSIRTIVLNFT
jgi:hypothetical protein